MRGSEKQCIDESETCFIRNFVVRPKLLDSRHTRVAPPFLTSLSGPADCTSLRDSFRFLFVDTSLLVARTAFIDHRLKKSLNQVFLNYRKVLNYLVSKNGIVFLVTSIFRCAVSPQRPTAPKCIHHNHLNIQFSSDVELTIKATPNGSPSAATAGFGCHGTPLLLFAKAFQYQLRQTYRRGLT